MYTFYFLFYFDQLQTSSCGSLLSFWALNATDGSFSKEDSDWKRTGSLQVQSQFNQLIRLASMAAVFVCQLISYLATRGAQRIVNHDAQAGTTTHHLVRSIFNILLL